MLVRVILLMMATMFTVEGQVPQWTRPTLRRGSWPSCRPPARPKPIRRLKPTHWNPPIPVHLGFTINPFAKTPRQRPPSAPWPPVPPPPPMPFVRPSATTPAPAPTNPWITSPGTPTPKPTWSTPPLPPPYPTTPSQEPPRPQTTLGTSIDAILTQLKPPPQGLVGDDATESVLRDWHSQVLAPALPRIDQAAQEIQRDRSTPSLMHTMAQFTSGLSKNLREAGTRHLDAHTAASRTARALREEYARLHGAADKDPVLRAAIDPEALLTRIQRHAQRAAAWKERGTLLLAIARSLDALAATYTREGQRPAVATLTELYAARFPTALRDALSPLRALSESR